MPDPISALHILAYLTLPCDRDTITSMMYMGKLKPTYIHIPTVM